MLEELNYASLPANETRENGGINTYDTNKSFFSRPLLKHSYAAPYSAYIIIELGISN